MQNLLKIARLDAGTIILEKSPENVSAMTVQSSCAIRPDEQTIIMITHSPSIAQTADRILRICDGTVTDLGRYRQ